MKNKSTTGLAALVALGVSVGMTAEVSAAELSAKGQLEGATVNKEVSTKNLKATDQLRKSPDVKLQDTRKLDQIKTDGPPRP
jgi:hypothetical protein